MFPTQQMSAFVAQGQSASLVILFHDEVVSSNLAEGIKISLFAASTFLQWHHTCLLASSTTIMQLAFAG